MEVAKVSSKGQITIPKEVREKLKLETGSKVVFLQQGEDMVVRNADNLSDTSELVYYRLTDNSVPALRTLQEAFEGEAERLGLQNEDDVVELIKKYRLGELE